MGVTDNKMFFKDLYADIEQSCSAEQLRNFANLDNDEARFQFVHALDGVRRIDELQRIDHKTKNANIALELKKQGNARFQAKMWPAALDCYNKSQLATPPENCEYVNRTMVRVIHIIVICKLYILRTVVKL